MAHLQKRAFIKPQRISTAYDHGTNLAKYNIPTFTPVNIHIHSHQEYRANIVWGSDIVDAFASQGRYMYHYCHDYGPCQCNKIRIK